MLIWKSANIFIFIRKYAEDFTLKDVLLFEICARENVKSLFKNIQKQKNALKLAYFLGNLQTSWANNVRILRINNEKFSRVLFLYAHKHIGGISNLH